jgi:hypothetical protein
MRKRTFLPLGITGAVLALLAPDAAADSCLDQVRSLAGRYDISTDPPTASPNESRPEVTTQDLARSGGVIEPPPMQDKSVITPPRDQGNAMPTMPDVKTPPPKDSRNSSTPPSKRPDLTALQALLVAARAQAERGSESECLEGLAKARQLIEHAEK